MAAKKGRHLHFIRRLEDVSVHSGRQESRSCPAFVFSILLSNLASIPVPISVSVALPVTLPVPGRRRHLHNSGFPRPRRLILLSYSLALLPSYSPPPPAYPIRTVHGHPSPPLRRHPRVASLFAIGIPLSHSLAYTPCRVITAILFGPLPSL
ncbi:hypothetical protein G7Z17_g5302 [Cylindrodendrum hubeiense]|uniref:Uncharacterized protein n=1 Tax=Cylindrodendrum hubeiense TaxID=595255 RepID=A0A9P5HD71_9HYPO|nr:hypothetical protein G7Z17_g5302 [Cylindrodendrum hubeiense]